MSFEFFFVKKNKKYDILVGTILFFLIVILHIKYQTVKNNLIEIKKKENFIKKKIKPRLFFYPSSQPLTIHSLSS